MSSGSSGTAPIADGQQLIDADGRYYKMLLENNYISDLSATDSATSTPVRNKSYEHFLLMEHSYSRDWRPHEGAHIMTTRTIMVHRPPQCPSCHIHTHDEGVDMNETYNPPIPTYNEEAAREAMLETERVASGDAFANSTAGSSSSRQPNLNTDAVVTTNQDSDHDWEETVDRTAWTRDQAALFAAVARILDLDRLSRLANVGRLHEPVLRRVVIDKSVARLRKALARFHCRLALTQWLHALLVDHLPPTYMAAYLDIMQTMRAKLPGLVEQMMRLRPASGPCSVHAALLAPVLRQPWEPCVAHKDRKLPGTSPVVVVVPAAPFVAGTGAADAAVPLRQQRWYDLLATMASVVPIRVPWTAGASVQTLTEQMVAVTRARVQEIRNEVQGRQIVLVGFGAGAALAVQVAMVEIVSSVVCMGFAYNTAGGVRGTADDRILDLTTPVMFVLGQNAARSSQEEIESLRERMQAQTSLVVVGSADDSLRVGHTKRQIEGVTQAMVDNMIIDEVAEFAATCIVNPPAPRDVTAELAANAKLANGPAATAASSASGCASTSCVAQAQKKRKGSVSLESAEPPVKALKTTAARVNMADGSVKPKGQRKVGRPRNAPTTPASAAVAAKSTAKSLAQQPTAEALDMAIASIMPSASCDLNDGAEVLSTIDLHPSMVLKPIQLPAGGLRKQPLGNSNAAAGTPFTVTQHQSQQQLQQQRNASVTSRPLAANTTLQKVQLVPAGNQFVQIKPPGLNTQKVYTLNAGASGSGTGSATKPQSTVFTSTTPTVLTSTTLTDNNTGRLSKVYTVKSTGSGNQVQLAGNGSGSICSSMQYVQNSVGGQFITTTLKPQQQQQQQHQQQQQQVSGGTIMLSPKKYTFLKQQQSGTTATACAPQIIKLKAATSATQADLASSSIFDMPIVFADSDGNIQDNAAAATPAGPAGISSFVTTTVTTAAAAQQQQQQQKQQQPLIISAQHSNQLQNRNLVINTVPPRTITSSGGTGLLQATVTGSGSGNKVVLINRPIKGAQSIQIGGGMSSMTMLPAAAMQKFTKINVSGAGSISLPVRTNIEMVRPQGVVVGQMGAVGSGTFTFGNKVNLISNSVIKSANAGQTPTVVPLRTAMGTFNVAAKTTQSVMAGQLHQHQPQPSTSSGVGIPVVFSVDADKTTIKNIVKVGDTQMKPTTSTATIVSAGGNNTVVLTPAGTLRPDPSAGSAPSPTIGGVQLKPNILNRSLTVRKVNLVPATQQQQQLLQLQMRNAAGGSSGLIVRQMVAGGIGTPLQGSQIVLQSPKTPQQQQKQQQQPPKPEP